MVERRLLTRETRDNDTAMPFHWRFTRANLDRRLAPLSAAPSATLSRREPAPAA